LLTPNTHKDLPATTSPRLAAKGFWGGSSTPFGGITPVHTVTIPDLIAGAALKPTLQENINPALNNNNNINSVGLSTLGGPGKPAPFDSFMDTNPFTMKMLDACVCLVFFTFLLRRWLTVVLRYRMQLWTRMAQQQQQQQHQLAAASQYQQQQTPFITTTLRPGSQPPSSLLFIHTSQARCCCRTIIGLPPQRQTSSPHYLLHIRIIRVSNTPSLSTTWFADANATTRGACDDGLDDTRPAPRKRILAGLFGLFVSLPTVLSSDTGCTCACVGRRQGAACA
jgi:hypothetical protein